MKDKIPKLYEGIEILCKNDNEINSLITPRYNDITLLLVRYINEIEMFNPVYSLVGSNDTDELVIKHILDSLAPLGIISRLLGNKGDISIADAGSGAGLPGIPLAIAMPDCQFTLIERMNRRAGFLLNTKAALDLSNVAVEETELEKTNKTFNLITFRAFKPLEPKLIKTLHKLLAPGGIIAAFKGKKEKTEAEIAQLKINNEILTVNNVKKTEVITWNWEIFPYTVPFLNEERHLLALNVK